MDLWYKHIIVDFYHDTLLLYSQTYQSSLYNKSLSIKDIPT